MKDYIVPACLTVFNFLFIGLVTWVARIKAKSDKSDVKKIVKDELKDTIKAVEDLQESRQFFKDAIADIHTYNKLSAEKSKNTRANIQETLKRQEDNFKEFMDEQRAHNLNVIKKIDEVVIEQAVIKSHQ